MDSMPLPVLVWVLTALAALVVVLTRARLRRGGEGAGKVDIARAPIGLHTTAGVLALATWTPYLFAPDRWRLLGGVGVGMWWLVTVAGLLILIRWLPTHGRHVAAATSDSWSEGPGLSLLAHLGMVVGALVFTYAFVARAL